MKIFHIVLKVILCLICAMPVMGALGVFPPPTQELYNTPEAFAFIQMLMATMYINWAVGAVAAAAIILIITQRTALAMLLLAPVTFNVIAFHLVLDGGLFTMGALLGDIMLLINAYFLWLYRDRYMSLWNKDRV